MELQKLDLSLYNDSQLKAFLNSAWTIVGLLARGYDEPIGTLNIDLITLLDKYMLQAGQILWEHESQRD